MNKKQPMVRTLLMVLFSAFVGGLSPSPIPAEWQEVLEKIDTLQADPLAPDAKELGKSIVKWLIDSKQVSVTLCADLTVPLTDKGDELGGLLAVHSLFGAAKYAMTTPQQQQSQAQMYLASLNGALDAYQKLVSKDAKYRRKRVEEVLESRAEGKLETYVRKHSKKCQK